MREEIRVGSRVALIILILTVGFTVHTETHSKNWAFAAAGFMLFLWHLIDPGMRQEVKK